MDTMSTIEISNNNSEYDSELGEVESEASSNENSSFNLYSTESQTENGVVYKVTLFGKPIYYFLVGIFCIFVFSALIALLIK